MIWGFSVPMDSAGLRPPDDSLPESSKGLVDDTPSADDFTIVPLNFNFLFRLVMAAISYPFPIL